MFHLRKEKSSVVYCKSTIYRGFIVPEAGLEPARLYRPRDFKSLVSTNSTTQALTQKIPTSIGTLWSGKRDSNSRPRPWQGRALPTELFPQHWQRRSGKRDSNSRPRPWQGRALPTELFPLANCGAKVQLFSIPQTFSRKNFQFFFLDTNFHQ